MAEKIKATHRKAGSCVGGYAGSNPAQKNNFALRKQKKKKLKRRGRTKTKLTRRGRTKTKLTRRGRSKTKLTRRGRTKTKLPRRERIKTKDQNQQNLTFFRLRLMLTLPKLEFSDHLHLMYPGPLMIKEFGKVSRTSESNASIVKRSMIHLR